MEEFIQEITKKAGEMAMQYFGKVGVKYTKAHALDPVTEADLAISKFLIEEIQKKYPDHAIISEEEEKQLGESEYVWIMDPIDGTLNFSRGTPLFGVMVALMHNDELELACINLPALGEFYFAQKGKGAFCNGEKISCSKFTELKDSYGTLGGPYKNEAVSVPSTMFRQSVEVGYTFTKLVCSATANAWAAKGARDWYVGNGGGLWDYAAPVLLLQESGCKVTNFAGEPWQFTDRQLIAANPELHAKIMKIAKQ